MHKLLSWVHGSSIRIKVLLPVLGRQTWRGSRHVLQAEESEKSITFYTGFYWQLCILYKQALKKIKQEAALSVQHHSCPLACQILEQPPPPKAKLHCKHSVTQLQLLENEVMNDSEQYFYFFFFF